MLNPNTTLKDIKKLDTIELTLSMADVRKYVKDNDLKMMSDLIHFPLVEGVIKAFMDNDKDVIAYNYFKKQQDDSYKVCFFSYIRNKYEFVYMVEQKFSIVDNEVICVTTSYNQAELGLNMSLLKERSEVIGKTLMDCLIYINHIHNNPNIIIKNLGNKGKSSLTTIPNDNDKRYRREIKLGEKVIYTVNASKEGIKSFKKYRRHIESWSVLGHYRKLKDGRVIYIKPYTKGSGIKEQKKYKV